MNIKHILILIFFTISYANKIQCMLSKPIRKSNNKNLDKTKKHKSDSISSSSESSSDELPPHPDHFLLHPGGKLERKNELKNHSNWLITLLASDQKHHY